jgi:hypothetical protein
MTCCVNGCTNKASRRSLCCAHYHRRRQYGDPTAGGPMRRRGTSRVIGLVDTPWAVVVLAGGEVALIDADDAALATGRLWHLSAYGYAQCRQVGPLHRLILPTAPGLQVDHINGNRLDNRRLNLRPATSSQNHANQRKRAGTTSTFKGVSWCRRTRRWVAQVMVDGRQQFIGRFDTEVEAARAYDARAEALFGEFAATNLTLGLYADHGRFPTADEQRKRVAS